VLRLRESVLYEVAVGVAVLALTALLVSRVPAVQDYAPPFTTTAVARDAESASIRLALDVDPTRAGPQTMRVRASGPDGVELPLTSLTGTLVAPDPDLGPVRVPFEVSGAGAVARDVVLAVPGTWTLTLQASTDPLTTYAATVTYDVK
jgi:copper transport protein